MTIIILIMATGGKIMANTKHNRQLDIIDPKLLNFPIRIIGAGGIGSWTTLALAKMGCSKLAVQDFDKVDITNTGSQFYSKDDIGNDKVITLKDIIDETCDEDINTLPFKWEPKQKITEPVVILALDSLETRKALWQELKKNPKVNLVIDGRMAGDFLRIFYVPLNGDYAKYEQYFVERNSIDPTPCTGKAVVYNVFMVASIITNLIKKYAKKELTQFLEFSFDLGELQIL